MRTSQRNEGGIGERYVCVERVKQTKKKTQTKFIVENQRKKHLRRPRRTWKDWSNSYSRRGTMTEHKFWCSKKRSYSPTMSTFELFRCNNAI
jgi:hypothetical protein